MSQTEILHSFNTSAEARAAGFTTLAWLRATSFNGHIARIQSEQAARKRDHQSEGDAA